MIKTLKVLNILLSGGIGGIEVLNMNIGLLSENKHTFMLLNGEGIIAEEMKSKGLEVISLAESNYCMKIIRIIEIARQYDIICVHHNAILPQMVYCVLHRFVPEKKYVFVAHSCFEEETYFDYKSIIKKRMRWYYLKRALSISDLLIFVSNAGKESYCSKFVLDREKLRVVYNGVITPNSAVSKNDVTENYELLYIGRLSKVKGLDLLLYAITNLRKKHKIKLNIVGDGDYKIELIKLINELELNDIVFLLGAQRNLAPYYKNADVFIYPSTCQEVFGISIVEALSQSIPCVAFRVGGIPEIIRDGENGFIAKNIGANELASAIESVLDLYKNGIVSINELRKNAYISSLRFSINNTVKQLDLEYSKLMNL